jgi:predicted lipoprotein with Yx(FWY)xxD motif
MYTENNKHKRVLFNLSFACMVSLLSACGSSSSDTPDSTTDNNETTENTSQAQQSQTPDDVSNTAIGDVLTNSSNLTLYTFDNDTAGASNCNDSCAQTWPPLFASSTASASGNFSIITRQDSSKQWAFKNAPLYLFSGDVNTGDTSGEGVGGTWFVARPNPFQSSTSSLGSILTAKANITDTLSDGSESTSDARVNKDGFSLYTFDNDTATTSNCNGGCAATWPPLFADEGATSENGYTIIDRTDGSKQWAFNERPLYRFSVDNAAGDTTGEGSGGVWFVARSAPVIASLSTTQGDILVAHGNIADVTAGGAKGTTSTDQTGISLYTFDADNVIGESSCNDGCAVTWPPLFAKDSDQASGDFTIITRNDGSKQWAYKNKPLYFFDGDSNPGDFGGVYGTWHAVSI